MKSTSSSPIRTNCPKLTSLLLLAGYSAFLSFSDGGSTVLAEELESSAPLSKELTSEQYENGSANQSQPVQLPPTKASLSEVATPEFSELESSVAQSEVVAEASTARLSIPARFSAEHSSSSAGFDGITGIGGFIPLSQTSGQDVTFLDGDLLLDNGGNLGWGLSLGHRGLTRDGSRIRGGHVGVDGRATDESTFYQLAAGYESLGEDWDFRFNGYLPLGNSLNTVRDINTDTGVVGSSGFENNQLVLSAVRERRRILQEEEALGGFDAEVATQLSEWSGGELTGAIGGYLLTGEETSLGGQLRLGATFKSNYSAGVALQHDGIFGTNVVVSIGLNLPNLRFQKKEDQEFQEANEVAIRLRDPIHRRKTVAVDQREERDITIERQMEPLRNPEEEQDYRFVHVSLGASGGDGTYEAPFGTVEEAIALISSDANTFSDGNTVLYVDGEAAPTTTIPGFAIPDRVRVLSQGPQQTIAGMAFPGFPETPTRLPFSPANNFNVPGTTAPNANGIAVLLPDSGDGVFPTVTGGAATDLVTLGNQTVLAGFQLDSASQNGVAGSNVTNVELRNNRIVNSTASGIALDNVGGSVTLFDNEISGSGDRGILAQNTTTGQSVNITIAGYQLANNRVGMEFNTVASSIGPEAPSQIISVSPSSADNTSSGNPSGAVLNNAILNSSAEGVIVQATGDVLRTSGSQEFSFDQGTVDGSGGAGMSFSATSGAHVQELNVTSSRITNNGAAGIAVLNGTPPNGATQTAASQEVVIRNSTISSNAGAGIDINLADASSQELVIRGNQITNNAGDGISSLAQNVSLQEWRNDVTAGDIGASENVITGNGGLGIDIAAQDLAALPVLGIADNTLAENGGASDIAVATTSSPTNPGSPTTCMVLRGNQVASSIQLTGLTTASTGGFPSFQVQDLANVIAANNGATIVFSSNTTTPDTAPFESVSGNCIE